MAGVRPMLATLADPPIVGNGLVYEPKYDGIRTLAAIEVDAKRNVRVSLYSRNGNEKHPQFPAATRALEQIGRRAARPLLLDGELVAIDRDGRPLGFQHIQGRIHLTGDKAIAEAERAQPVVFIAFDILRDGPEDLRGLPYAARRLKLQQVVPRTRSQKPVVRLSEIALDDGRPMLERARQERWEGLIVKQGDSVYHSGRRSPAWRKLKLLSEQEFVVGGWTEPRQSRQHFGSLILGYYDGVRTDKLIWAGLVGTGFTGDDLAHIATLLAPLERRTSPFGGPVKTMEKPHWVEPKLVVQVRFTEWTSDGVLRHPAFLGLRDDKKPRDVVRELVDRPQAPAIPVNANRYRRGRPRVTPPASGESVVEQLRAIEAARKDGDIHLPNGDTLRVTNLQKIFWPDLGLTKGDLLRYYAEVADYLLPVVADRPLVMRRFPNGVDRHAFYQQKHPEQPPPGVRRGVLPPEVDPPDDSGPRERLIGGSWTTLMYMAQLAAISQDPWFSRVDDPEHQDYAAIDLDPGDGTPFGTVLEVARLVKAELDRYGIPAAAKTSGASGLHIYIRLPPKTTYDTGQLLCRLIATAVADANPRIATIERTVKKRRRGTVYVDYLQNILGKTLATAYSARASDYAGVSTPLTWDEVAGKVDPRAFTIRTAPARFREVGDLWGQFLAGPAVDLRKVIENGSKS
jgi:bifunctional non-homologous end joining protein LigD